MPAFTTPPRHGLDWPIATPDTVAMDGARLCGIAERLKAQEQQKGFRERPPQADQDFFREGRAGQWRDVLTPAQIEQLVRDHGEQMRRFGYLSEDIQAAPAA